MHFCIIYNAMEAPEHRNKKLFGKTKNGKGLKLSDLLNLFLSF